jgi:hypothetical protein
MYEKFECEKIHREVYKEYRKIWRDICKNENLTAEYIEENKNIASSLNAKQLSKKLIETLRDIISR